MSWLALRLEWCLYYGTGHLSLPPLSWMPLPCGQCCYGHSRIETNTTHSRLEKPLRWPSLPWPRYRPLTTRLSSPVSPKFMRGCRSNPSQTLQILFSAILPLVFNDLLYLASGNALYSTHYTASHTPVSKRLRSRSPPVSFGLESIVMFVGGFICVYSVNMPRYGDTSQLPSLHFPFQTPDLMTSKLISLDPCHAPSRGFTYLLTCVNCFARWPEAIPFTASIAETR